MDSVSTRRAFLRRAGSGAAGLALSGSAAAAFGPLAGDYNVKEELEKDHYCPVHVFSKHLQFLDYNEMAALCAEAGLDGADLTVRPGGHVLPEHVEKDLPRAERAIRSAGLRLTMMTTRITDPGDPLTEKILDTAAGLGIRYYRLGYYKYEADRSTSENLDNFRRKMEGLARLNEKYGIHGAYQNHAGGNFGAPVWDLWELLKDLDPEWMGCQYDIRHAVVEGAQTWSRPLELLKDHIRCMVIKDFRWEAANGQAELVNVPLGEGIIDFDTYFGYLRKFEIKGPVSLHMEYPLFPDQENMPVKEKKKKRALNAIKRDLAVLKTQMKNTWG